MGKVKAQNKTVAKNIQKKKKIQKTQKPEPLENKISIKKLTNEKQIVAEFPFIRGSNGKQQMSIPLFRRDRLEYTPGFCLPDEFSQQFVSQQQILHQYRISSESTMIDCENIKIPKPSSRNSYCTICKIRFDDYKQHIELPEHLSKMRNSHYNKLIEELCQKKQVQRFFMPNEKIQESTIVFCQNKYQSIKIFNDQQNQKELQKIDRRSTGDIKQTKEQLYKKVMGQKAQHNKQEQQQIFDVLAC